MYGYVQKVIHYGKRFADQNILKRGYFYEQELGKR